MQTILFGKESKQKNCTDSLRSYGNFRKRDFLKTDGNWMNGNLYS